MSDPQLTAEGRGVPTSTIQPSDTQYSGMQQQSGTYSTGTQPGMQSGGMYTGAGSYQTGQGTGPMHETQEAHPSIGEKIRGAGSFHGYLRPFIYCLDYCLNRWG